MSRLLRWAAAILLAVGAGASAEPRVELALVLAVDASGSVDQHRFELQKQGYVAAFRNPRVLDAIRSGSSQAIAVTMFQWTGPRLHVQVVPWTLIKDEASAEAFAASIAAVPRQLFGGGTSISGAIDYARALLAQVPAEPTRRVIDVSGDGSNNSGRAVTTARDEAVGAGIGINGLPILSIEPDLDGYYRDYVIGGPGAFMVPADSYDTFAQAILKKLITEIAATRPCGQSCDQRRNVRTRAAMLETERKLAGVISLSGMATSSSASTASTRFTMSSDVRPISRRSTCGENARVIARSASSRCTSTVMRSSAESSVWESSMIDMGPHPCRSARRLRAIRVAGARELSSPHAACTCRLDSLLTVGDSFTVRQPPIHYERTCL